MSRVHFADIFFLQRKSSLFPLLSGSAVQRTIQVRSTGTGRNVSLCILRSTSFGDEPEEVHGLERATVTLFSQSHPPTLEFRLSSGSLIELRDCAPLSSSAAEAPLQRMVKALAEVGVNAGVTGSAPSGWGGGGGGGGGVSFASLGNGSALGGGGLSLGFLFASLSTVPPAGNPNGPAVRVGDMLGDMLVEKVGTIVAHLAPPVGAGSAQSPPLAAFTAPPPGVAKHTPTEATELGNDFTHKPRTLAILERDAAAGALANGDYFELSGSEGGKI